MVLLDVCDVVIGSPYLWDHDIIFMRRGNEWRLVKEEKPYLINTYNDKKNISLILINKAKPLVNGNKKFMILVVRPKEDKIA